MRALIDTSALLALSHARDQYHARAVEIMGQHRAIGGTFVSTTLVDAVSFKVMRAEKVAAAFAFDHHFEVAGFELLR